MTHSFGAPIGGKSGRVIGAVRLINKIVGEFTADQEQMARYSRTGDARRQDSPPD